MFRLKSYMLDRLILIRRLYIIFINTLTMIYLGLLLLPFVTHVSETILNRQDLTYDDLF